VCVLIKKSLGLACARLQASLVLTGNDDGRIHAHTCTHTHTTHTHTHTHMFIHKNASVHTAHVHTQAYTHAFTCLHMCVCPHTGVMRLPPTLPLERWNGEWPLTLCLQECQSPIACAASCHIFLWECPFIGPHI
jgi:hypothetical protein